MSPVISEKVSLFLEKWHFFGKSGKIGVFSSKSYDIVFVVNLFINVYSQAKT